MPHFDTIRSGQELVVSSSTENDVCQAEDGTLIGLTPGGDINVKDASISSPSREEIVALLRQVPCFIMLEPPAQGINALFPLTRQYFVDLSGNPPIIVAPRLPHNTSKFVLLYI